MGATNRIDAKTRGDIEGERNGKFSKVLRRNSEKFCLLTYRNNMYINNKVNLKNGSKIDLKKLLFFA